jgi:hypothetical protein
MREEKSMKHYFAAAIGLVAVHWAGPVSSQDAVPLLEPGATAPSVQIAPKTATKANSVNPYELLDLTLEQLAERFPNMPKGELEKLMFRIADIISMRSL